MSEKLLEARGLTMQFGGLKCVDTVDLHVGRGELMGLIGPNGAGKTTIFNMLTGVYEPTKGTVVFEGQVLNGLKPYQIARKGLTRTFQNIRLFRDQSVIENVLVGSSHLAKYGILAPVMRTASYLKIEAEQIERARHLLSIFGLEAKRDFPSGSLPYGEQRKLEIVRALATQPKMICLDEPAAGMNHQETHNLMELIAKIRNEFSLTVLLIEHDMKLVMGICERIVVLDHGCKIEEGPPAVVQSSQKVIEAYLGVDAT
ncbi:MAG: ABC transporter ATP-binding protein [Bdellovibrio sp.]|jgi:branched-chain amino acid transport system ATP-binding protein